MISQLREISEEVKARPLEAGGRDLLLESPYGRSQVLCSEGMGPSRSALWQYDRVGGIVCRGDGRGPWFDLRLREMGVGPFASLEDFECLQGSFLVKRQCLEEAGSGDEDLGELGFADLILRCRKKGWRILCDLASPAPAAKKPSLFSKPHFYFWAKHFPVYFVLRLKEAERKLRNLPSGELETFFLKLFQKLLEWNDPESVSGSLRLIAQWFVEFKGKIWTDHLLARLEVIQGYRSKPSLAIYDHALHTVGGGQKYACTMAALLQDDYEITFLSNKPVTIKMLEIWYRLDLSRCRVKILRMPFYEDRGGAFIDQAMAALSRTNPFDLISEASRSYDIFINVNMLTKVKPRSPVSIFLCHFPDSKKGRHFAVSDYTYIVANSRYTIHWLKKRWGLQPHRHIYPPIEMEGPSISKEPVILSVARFDPTGFKRQLELIEAFESLCRREPVLTQGWKFVLAGGTLGPNFYLKKIEKRVLKNRRIELYQNIPIDRLQALYASASIFWHACGLKTRRPEHIEHFGMATVEAMQNRCVPVVINKGGQKEIVEDGVSGFLFDDLKELEARTLELIVNPSLRNQFSEGAFKKSRDFHRSFFDEKIRKFFEEIRGDYFRI
jgi:glycosyltransferase involved in cell wall biosynthesis